MSKKSNAETTTHAYVASCPHGWTFGITLDMGNKITAETVSEWIAQGYVVDRTTKEEAKERFLAGCKEGCVKCGAIGVPQ